ncbi:MAG TPA: hypothetical protein PLO33_16895 [Kouleothrix sp.]|uniref:hypothetical protein n=1 Tax=Kouleothrix sp. TaxID=2779161 RepID=UPI002BFB1893|nr:hypothetical protein [Kouleothrix sp.]HRC77362.1 hypothetical protein [Kouleothrix sp.]
MEREPRSRRWRAAAATAVLLAVLGLAGLGALLYRSFQATEYPGATRVADATITRYTPNFVIRRTSVYRTTDAFNKVYNWYSVRFALGPESYAQSNCILMSASRPRGWGLDEQMSVMVCGTPNDQMMFVMRALIFRYPRFGLL